MKTALALAFVLVSSSAFAQAVHMPLHLNPMTELLTSLTPAPAPLTPEPTLRDRVLADLDAKWEQDRAVFEAELRVLRTRAAYADAAAKEAEFAAMRNRVAPVYQPVWQFAVPPPLPPLPPLPVHHTHTVHCNSMVLLGQFIETTCQ